MQEKHIFFDQSGCKIKKGMSMLAFLENKYAERDGSNGIDVYSHMLVCSEVISRKSFKRAHINISNDNYEKFIKLYVTDKSLLLKHFSEKPKEIMNIHIDFDLNCPLENNRMRESLYTYHDITEIYTIFCRLLGEYIIHDKEKDKMIYTCFILEKEFQIVNFDTFKNGFHLAFPNIFLNKAKIRELFEKLIECLENIRDSIFIKTPELSVDKIVDANASLVNHWLMYGSCKNLESKPYEITGAMINKSPHIIKKYEAEEDAVTDYVNDEFFDVIDACPFNTYDSKRCTFNIDTDPDNVLDYRLVCIMSTIAYGRKTYDVKKVSDKQLKLIKPRFELNQLLPEDRDFSINSIRSLLLLLSDSRADDFWEWFSIGTIIHGLTKGSEGGFGLFVEFSKRCFSKWIKEEEYGCARYWNVFFEKNKFIKMEDLTHLVTFDNYKTNTGIWNEICKILHPENLSVYSTLKLSKPVQNLTYARMYLRKTNMRILASSNKSIVSSFSGKQFVFIPGKRWEEDYNFSVSKDIENTLNRIIQHAYSVAQAYYLVRQCEINTDDMSETIASEFTKERSGEYLELYGDLSLESEERQKLKGEIANLSNLANAIHSTEWINKIILAVQRECFCHNFLDIANPDPFIFPFEDQVFDCNIMRCRPSIPADNILFHAPTPYIAYSEDHEDMAFFDGYWSKVFPIPEEAEYALYKVAQCLIAKNSNQRITNCLGNASGGKSFWASILKHAFGDGDYSLGCTFNMNVLKEEVKAGSADPDLMFMFSRNFLIAEESNGKTRFNTKRFKELCSAAAIPVRGLFKEISKPKEITGNIFICTNNPANLDNFDAACWRRLDLIMFRSRFVYPDSPYYNPDPEIQRKTLCFEIDSKYESTESKTRLARVLLYKCTQVLIERKATLGAKWLNPMPRPTMLQQDYDNMKESESPIYCYINEKFEPCSDTQLFLLWSKIYVDFNNWFSRTKKIIQSISKDYLREDFESWFKTDTVNYNGDYGFPGWKLKDGCTL